MLLPLCISSADQKAPEGPGAVPIPGDHHKILSTLPAWISYDRQRRMEAARLQDNDLAKVDNSIFSTYLASHEKGENWCARCNRPAKHQEGEGGGHTGTPPVQPGKRREVGPQNLTRRTPTKKFTPKTAAVGISTIGHATGGTNTGSPTSVETALLGNTPRNCARSHHNWQIMNMGPRGAPARQGTGI